MRKENATYIYGEFKLHQIWWSFDNFRCCFSSFLVEKSLMNFLNISSYLWFWFNSHILQTFIPGNYCTNIISMNKIYSCNVSWSHEYFYHLWLLKEVFSRISASKIVLILVLPNWYSKYSNRFIRKIKCAIRNWNLWKI